MNKNFLLRKYFYLCRLYKLSNLKVIMFVGIYIVWCVDNLGNRLEKNAGIYWKLNVVPLLDNLGQL